MIPHHRRDGTSTLAARPRVANPKAALDKDGFLKLFVAQLQHQDPSSPMDTNDSMPQMASFSMVEQITNMATTNTKIAASLNTSSAVCLIGCTVTYMDAKGVPQTGKVERVATSKDGVASLTVGGNAGIDPTSISEVTADPASLTELRSTHLMMRGMFAAISGLKQHQVMLDVTANDIANVNTIGYKSSRVTFQDSLTQMQRGAAAPTTNNGGSNAAQVGLGVGLGSVDNLMTGGAVQTTGNPLDVAIQGDGFFQIGSGAPTAGARRSRRPPTPARATSRSTPRAS